MEYDLTNAVMKPDEFEAAFKGAIDFAETRIGDKPDEIIPYLFIHYREDENDKLSDDIRIAMCALAVDLICWDDKVKMMRGLGAKCHRDRWLPLAVFFVAEALTNRQTPKKGEKIVKPYDDPNAQECMVVMGQEVGSNAAVGCTVPLVRDEGGLFRRHAPNAIARDMQSPLLREFWIGFAIAAMSAQPPPDEGEEWKKG